MDVVVADGDIVSTPELAAAAATTAFPPDRGLGVRCVVSGDLVAVEQCVGRRVMVGRYLETVLPILRQTVEADHVPRPSKERCAHKGHGVVAHRPVGTAVVVYRTLVVRRREVADREMFDGDISGVAPEGGLVYSLTVEDGARRADKRRVAAWLDLIVLTVADGVDTGREPEGLVVRREATHPVRGQARVVPRRNDDSAGGRARRTVEQRGVTTDGSWALRNDVGFCARFRAARDPCDIGTERQEPGEDDCAADGPCDDLGNLWCPHVEAGPGSVDAGVSEGWFHPKRPSRCSGHRRALRTGASGAARLTCRVSPSCAHDQALGTATLVGVSSVQDRRTHPSSAP